LLALKYVIHISATFYLFFVLSNFESNWFIKGVIGFLISFLIALGLKLIRPFELIRLLKSEQQ